MSPLEVVTTHTTGESDGQGYLRVVWDVECTYKEAVALVEEPECCVSRRVGRGIGRSRRLVCNGDGDAEGVEIEDAEAVVAVAAADCNASQHFIR